MKRAGPLSVLCTRGNPKLKKGPAHGEMAYVDVDYVINIVSMAVLLMVPEVLSPAFTSRMTK
jgi:hypothetical protein